MACHIWHVSFRSLYDLQSLKAEVKMSDNVPRRRRPPPKQKAQGAPLWITSLFLIALVGLMVWVADRFIEFDKLQRCVTAGHRDCGQQPVDTSR